MRFLFILFTLATLTACGQQNIKTTPNNTETTEDMKHENPIEKLKMTDFTPQTGIDTATFGAGCFWCVEAVFQRLEGVISVKSGYAGGHIKTPSYREVSNGTTGHAEVAQIIYDASKISYVELLEVFWLSHDPTTLNAQGADHGTQYRSAIFYHNAYQKQVAEKSKDIADASGLWNSPIVTEISPLDKNYYPAEDYHQNYYNENGEQGYCRIVIAPKVEKLKKLFHDKLKEAYQ